MVVQAPDNTLLNAINSLPEKLSATFKEIFPVNPRPDQPQQQPTQQPAQQQQTQQPAQQPQQPAQQPQQPQGRWNFGKWYLTGKGK